LIIHNLNNILTTHLNIKHIQILNNKIITPNHHLAYLTDAHTNLNHQLNNHTIIIKPNKHNETLVQNIKNVAHRNKHVDINQITHNKHLNIIHGHSIKRLTLHNEDHTVHLKQITTLHTLGAQTNTDKQHKTHTIKNNLNIITNLNTRQQQKRTIVKLHHDTLKRLQHQHNLKQPQLHKNIKPKQNTTHNTEQQTIADLANNTNNNNLNKNNTHDTLLNK